MTALSKEQLAEIRERDARAHRHTNLLPCHRDVRALLAHIDAMEVAREGPRVCYGPAIAYPLAVTAHEPYVPYNKPVSSDETCDALEGMALLFEEGRSADIEDVAIDYLRDAVARLRRAPAPAVTWVEWKGDDPPPPEGLYNVTNCQGYIDTVSADQFDKWRGYITAYLPTPLPEPYAAPAREKP